MSYTSHLSGVQLPPVASGCHIDQYRSSTFRSSQKLLLRSTDLALTVPQVLGTRECKCLLINLSVYSHEMTLLNISLRKCFSGIPWYKEGSSQGYEHSNFCQVQSYTRYGCLRQSAGRPSN